MADPKNFDGENDQIYKHKLLLISKFRMFMINVLDLEQTCFAFSLIRRVARNLQWGEGGCYGSLWAPPTALENFVCFWHK